MHFAESKCWSVFFFWTKNPKENPNLMIELHAARFKGIKIKLYKRIINLYKTKIHFLKLYFDIFFSLFKLIVIKLILESLIALILFKNYIFRPCPTSTILFKDSIKHLLKSRPSSGKSEMSISSHKNCSFRLSRNVTNSSKP